MKKRSDINRMITERLLERIRTTKTLPWKKPWSSPNMVPKNLVSKKNYRGINAFLLHAMGYESPYWMTLRQVNSLGGKVRKGEHSTPVVFWKFFESEDNERSENAPAQKRYAMLRYYRVFNAVQCDGLKVENVPLTAEFSSSDRSKAIELTQDMPNPPSVFYGYRQAYYSKIADRVCMPHKSSFDSEDAFFSCLFHELSHSTGHPSRLNRKSLMENKVFGSEPYSQEELVAEMTAGFLCGHCGILATVESNTAAYLKHWVEKLQAEPSLLLKAGSQAQKAFDHILGIPDPKTDKTPKTQPAGAVLAPVN